ncbi:MAG: hypothetical protein ABH840_04105 [Nanoarchaeota archaeon]
MGLRRLAAVLFLGVLGIGGCNEFEGVVLSKNYEPGRMWKENKRVVLYDGQRYATGTADITCYDDEDYVLTVRKDGVVRNVYTSEENFNNSSVGWFYKKKSGDKEVDYPIKKLLRPGETLTISGKRLIINR